MTPRPPRAPEQRGGDLEPAVTPERLSRRKFAWFGLNILGLAIGGCTVKYFFPRAIYEPKTSFKVGRKDDYGFGVDDLLQDKYRIWVCRDAQRLYVIKAICTHVGCTPNWVASANKFKCPCHGSGYDSAGVNFEGPAPRPLERVRVVLAEDGQILVDKSRHFQRELGQWTDPEAFLKA